MITRLAFFILTLSPFIVFGCGITTHIEVSRRARDLWLHQPIYRQYVLQYEDAFQAGSPYPDSFYNELCFYSTLNQTS